MPSFLWLWRALTLLLLESRSLVQGNAGAVIVTPSGRWDGNDGPWSSFAVNIGAPKRQTVRLLPALAVHFLAVIDMLGCPSGYYPSSNDSVSDCIDSRGGIFNSVESTTWVDQDVYSTQVYDELGYDHIRGDFGYDQVFFGIDVSHQVIATLAAPKFWLGMFGLSFLSVNLSDTNNPQASFLEELRQQENILSRTWSYTAGAYHRSKHASLILGGYDSFKFQSAAVLSIPFSADGERTFQVQVKAIATSTAGPFPGSNFSALIDPGVSSMWLPVEVCDALASAFGLELNPTIGLYLINKTTHERNLAERNHLRITVCNGGDSCLELDFPYEAFALNASFPLLTGDAYPLESQRYFPIIRANDSSQYTLGRAFMQETHLFADWDNRRFNISQARFDESYQQIVPVTGPKDAPDLVSQSNSDSSTSGAPSGSQPSNLSGGAIAGVSVGSVVFLLLVLAGSTFIMWRTKRWPFKRRESPPDDAFNKAELENTAKPFVELSEGERVEMHAHEPPKELPPGEQNAELPGCTPIYELPDNQQISGHR